MTFTIFLFTLITQVFTSPLIGDSSPKPLEEFWF
jgi:hypothetical protein